MNLGVPGSSSDVKNTQSSFEGPSMPGEPASRSAGPGRHRAKRAGMRWLREVTFQPPHPLLQKSQLQLVICMQRLTIDEESHTEVAEVTELRVWARVYKNRKLLHLRNTAKPARQTNMSHLDNLFFTSQTQSCVQPKETHS